MSAGQRSSKKASSRTKSSWVSGSRISVVIPALNEAENLPHVLPWIPAWVDEVLLVDGHSSDGTAEVAKQLRPDIKVVVQEAMGKGAALRAGLAEASGDIVVMLDADGSTNPREIPAFVGMLLAGADFVKGSRFIEGGGSDDLSLIRALGNKMLLLLVRLLFGFRFTDLCYGYTAVRSTAVARLELNCSGFEVETLMNIRARQRGLRVAELPSFEARRLSGSSRLRAVPDGWRVLKVILAEWWRTLPSLRPRALRQRLSDASSALPAPGVPVQEQLVERAP